MKKTKVGFIKTVHYFCLVGIAVLGLITIIATGGGGGGGDGGGGDENVTITGFVDDGTPNSPISNAYCVFVDLNGVQQRYAFDTADTSGYFSIKVLPDQEGYIQCTPSGIPRLILSTFLSTKDRAAGDKISGENVTPTTTVVADIINSENVAVPQARKLELLNAIENGDPDLNLLVKLTTILFKAMLDKQINVNLGGWPGGDGNGDGDSAGAGGDAGDGADASPIPNAHCDFALDLEGKVLYSSALDDLGDGELDRPDLAAIKEEVEEEVKDLKSKIKIALDKNFPDGVGIPYSDIADENGRYFLPIPPKVQGYVRCSPPDQPKLKMATLVPKLQEGEVKDDQDVTPATTIFSHSIATELSGDLDTVKENYLVDIAGLGDIQIIKDGETVTGFQLKETSDPSDKDVGLVAFSAASLFNILYKNDMDVDYLDALDGLIYNQEVRSEDLESLGIPKADAEKWSEVVNDSNKDAGVDLDPTNPVILGDALSKARIKVTVLDWLDGKGILGAEVDITDAPSFIECKDCPGETDENGEVTLTLTGVKTEPAEITVKTSGVSGFKDKYAKTKVVAFATVGLESVMTPMFLLQVTKSGTGGGTVTSSPAGISCGTDCTQDYIEDTVVSLAAQANADSNFTGWSGGGCSGTGTCTVTMDQAQTVTATFTLIPVTQNTLTVTKTGTGSGTVTSSPSGINCGSDCNQTYNAGTRVTLYADPTGGSTFAGWSGGGCSGTGTCTVTMDQAQTVTATFTLIPVTQNTLTVTKTGTGSGTVTSSPSGINCGSDCNQTYNAGTRVTLYADPTGGSTFAGWSGGGCSGTGTCTVTMDEPRTVTATFTFIPVQNTLTVTKTGTGSGTVTSSPSGINCGSDCNQTYNADTRVTLYADPTGGSTFAGWSGGGCSGTGTCTVTMDEPRTVTATFTLPPPPPPCTGFEVPVYPGRTGDMTEDVEMGRSSGTFLFEYEMFRDKDRMTIRYEGGVIFDSGCISTYDIGRQTRQISYSGSSTVITVVVDAGCDGINPDSGWALKVHCPQ